MIGAQRVMVVIPMATVARVREHHVRMLVVADPIVATICLRQVSALSAKTALAFQYGLSCLGLLRFHFHFRDLDIQFTGALDVLSLNGASFNIVSFEESLAFELVEEPSIHKVGRISRSMRTYFARILQPSDAPVNLYRGDLSDGPVSVSGECEPFVS